MRHNERRWDVGAIIVTAYPSFRSLHFALDPVIRVTNGGPLVAAIDEAARRCEAAHPGGHSRPLLSHLSFIIDSSIYH